MGRPLPPRIGRPLIHVSQFATNTVAKTFISDLGTIECSRCVSLSNVSGSVCHCNVVNRGGVINKVFVRSVKVCASICDGNHSTQLVVAVAGRCSVRVVGFEQIP